MWLLGPQHTPSSTFRLAPAAGSLLSLLFFLQCLKRKCHSIHHRISFSTFEIMIRLVVGVIGLLLVARPVAAAATGQDVVDDSLTGSWHQLQTMNDDWMGSVHSKPEQRWIKPSLKGKTKNSFSSWHKGNGGKSIYQFPFHMPQCLWHMSLSSQKMEEFIQTFTISLKDISHLPVGINQAPLMGSKGSTFFLRSLSNWLLTPNLHKVKLIPFFPAPKCRNV